MLNDKKGMSIGLFETKKKDLNMNLFGTHGENHSDGHGREKNRNIKAVNRG